jgi:hypothetical protein
MLEQGACFGAERGNSFSAPADISLQHIGTKGSGSPPLSPCGWRRDRVSPVPVFSLNYGAILAIAPPFLVERARGAEPLPPQ